MIMRESGVSNFTIFSDNKMMQPHLLRCNVTHEKLNAAYESIAWAFIFYLGEVVCWIVEWFHLVIWLYMMSVEDFSFFIRVFKFLTMSELMQSKLA